MLNYREFKVEAERNHTQFSVLVKGWFGWKNGYVYTNYFKVSYRTEQEALESIKGYKNRFTCVSEN